MRQDEKECEVAPGTFTDVIRSRLQTPRYAFIDGEQAFGPSLRD